MPETINLKEVDAFRVIQERFLIPWELLEKYARQHDNDPDRVKKNLSEDFLSRNDSKYSDNGFLSYVIVNGESFLWEGTPLCGHGNSPCDCPGPVRAVCHACYGRFSIKRNLKNQNCNSCEKGKLIAWDFLSKGKKREFLDHFAGNSEVKNWLTESLERKSRSRVSLFGNILFFILIAGSTWYSISNGFTSETILTYILFPFALFAYGFFSSKIMISRIRAKGEQIDGSNTDFGKLFLRACLKKSAVLISFFVSVIFSILIIGIISGFTSALESEDGIWWLLIGFLVVVYLGYLYDANGAANYRAEMIVRADQANRLYLENNQAKFSDDKEGRLTEIENLRQSGKISDQEYRSARKKIIEG